MGRENLLSPKWDRPARIRVVLLKTATYHVCSHGCVLEKIAALLNKSQTCYEFFLLKEKAQPSSGRSRWAGLNLERRKPLQFRETRSAAPKSIVERDRAVETYIEEEDAFSQIVSYVKTQLDLQKGGKLADDDLIIAIGGEVVVPDISDNEFEGEAARDAYSCTWFSGTGTCDGSEYGNPDILDDNDHLGPLQRAAYISLRRADYVFPEIIFTDSPERARAIMARYIIFLITSFLGNRTFRYSLFHHDMSGCLNESNWVGGERDSYFVAGYCTRCQKSHEQFGCAKCYKGWGANRVNSAIEELLSVSDYADKIVKSTRRTEFWVEFALVAVAMNIVSAMLMDVGIPRLDTEKDVWFTHIKTHSSAGALALLAVIFAVILIWRHIRHRRQLP